MTLSASSLFAQCNGEKLTGDWECYFCGCACTQKLQHNLPRPQIGQKRDPFVRRPASPYVCSGCYLFQRASVTVNFLEPKHLKDRQSPINHSWLITEEGCWGIRKEDFAKLYTILLKPPIPFTLALIDLTKEPKATNRLHSMVVNDPLLIKASDSLSYTLNNQTYCYTVYELEIAIQKKDTNGLEPGTRLLVDHLGFDPAPYIEEHKEEPKEKSAGRPPALPTAHKTVNKTVRKS